MLDIFAELDTMYNEVKDKEGVFENLPDGEYLVELLGVELGQSKAGRPMVTSAFKVTYGEKQGATHKTFNVLVGDTEQKTKQALNRFAIFARTLGASTSAGVKATVEALEALKGQTYVMTLKTTGDWTNTTFAQK